MTIPLDWKDNPLPEALKAEAERRGYRFEVDEQGSITMIRPDGSVAVTAHRKPGHSRLIFNKETKKIDLTRPDGSVVESFEPPQNEV